MDVPAVLVLDDGDLELCCRILAEEGEDFVYLSGARGSGASREMGAGTDEAATRSGARPFWPTALLITNARVALEMSAIAGPMPERPDLRWYCLERGPIGHRRGKLARVGVHVVANVLRATTREADRDLVALLVREALFEGAERRDHVRLPCSFAMHFEIDGARHEATLLELSRRGCRFRAAEPLPSGTPVQVFLPREIDPDAPTRLYARVARSAFAPELGGRRAPGSVAVRFEPDRTTEPILDAVLRGLEAGGPVRTLHAPPTRELLLTDPDRRDAARHRYERHVAVSRGSGDGAPEVLRGHDLSMKGLRLARAPGVEVGSEVIVALHRGAGREPLCLPAEVRRDHGEAGLGLVFGEFPLGGHEELAVLLRELPQLELFFLGEDDSDPFVLCSIAP